MNPAVHHVRLLLAMPEQQQEEIIGHLQGKGVEIFGASNCAEVAEVLQRHSPIQVILTVPEFKDGCWRSILKDLAQHGSDAEVVVCVEKASIGFWCDALEQGAYDLLLAPYRPEQVRAVVEAAAAQSVLHGEGSQSSMLRLGADLRRRAGS